MEERFDRLEVRLYRLEKLVANLVTEVRHGFRATAASLDVHSRQIAGVSKRIDGLTRHQKQFAANFSKRLGKTEAKAQITIEGHEAIRSEMHREFTTLRRDLDMRVQPIEWAVKRRRSI
jgi:hypothetical protein